MKNLLSLLTLLLLLLVFSCKEDIIVESEENPKPLVRESIDGFVQKGPFAIGTSINVSELDSLLSQTGRNFNTQISTSDGSFQVNNIILNSSLVEIKADGFYYNEVTGDVSENRLTLYALSDLFDKSTVNVNVLSYLEKERIKYLVENGKSFEDAKKQAQKEVLKIFEIEKDDIVNSEQMDILKEGEDNAILLASSIILQGGRSVAELSELLAKISLDIKTDGILDDTICGSQLINHAKVMKLNSVRSNMEYKYQLLGKTNEVPGFESYVSRFVDNTNFKYTFKIEYPEGEKNSPNLLSLEDGVTVRAPFDYSLKTILPLNHSLKVRMIKSSQSHGFAVYSSELSGFETKTISPNITEFTTKPGIAEADQKLKLEREGSGTIEIYENGATTPTKTINYAWTAPESTGLISENYGKFGENLFLLDDNTVLESGQTYSLELTMPTDLNLNINLWIIRTSNTGTISFDERLVENWNARYSAGFEGGINATCRSSGVHLDMPITLSGVGECSLELKADNSSNQIIYYKNFKWE